MGSLALRYFVSEWWCLFIAFVGLTLFQPAFTDWRPVMTFLQTRGAHSPGPKPQVA